MLNPGFSLRTAFKARRRGEPLRTGDLLAAKDPPALAALLLRLRTARDPRPLIRGLSAARRRELIRAGILVAPGHAPAPVSFSCPLSARLLDLAPREAIARLARRPSFGLKVRAGIAVQTGLARPAGWRDRLPPPSDFPTRDGEADVRRGEAILWVRDPRTALCWPYWLDREARAEVAALSAGRLAPADLAPERRLLLRLAGLLVGRGERRPPLPRAILRRRPFAVVPGIVPPLQLAALRRYVRALESEGCLALGRQDGRPQRLVSHNDRVAAFLHRQSGRLASRIAGEPLVPSYSMISAYLPGASLKRHVDRPQCRWNASLLVDMDPEAPRGRAWPFHLRPPGGETETVRLGMGDCVVYPGTEIPHWRVALPRNERQTLLFLHYVPLHFPGSLG